MAGFNKPIRRKSFFAEQRELNMNPNFINNMDFMLLRQNVKRILRDVSDNLITTEDYGYFRSDNVLNACIQESYEQYQTNKCLRNALTLYRNIGLPQRMVTPDVDINTEYTTAGIELSKACDRENVWWAAYNIFLSIQAGADPATALINIMRIQRNSIKSL